MSTLPPVFVVGVGRSGTTLLRAMLNAGGEYYIPYESEFIARAYPYYKDKAQFSHDDYRRIARQFQFTSQNRGWGMSEEYIIAHLDASAPQTFAGVNDVIYNAYLKHIDVENTQWGIKTPYLMESLDVIFDVFPSAKVLHIVRDVRDVYLSYSELHKKHKRSFGPSGMVTTAYFWAQRLRRMECIQDSRIYELRYEDLVNAPEVEVKKMCAFLGINFSKRMYEDWHQSRWNEHLTLQKEAGQHAKTNQGIDKANTAKYLTRMTRFQRLVFELAGGWFLKQYNYPVEHSIMSSRLMYTLNSPIYAFAQIYRNWHNRRKKAKYFRQ